MSRRINPVSHSRSANKVQKPPILLAKSAGRGDRCDRRRPLLFLELQPIKQGVAAVLAQQIVVPAGFGDAAVLEHIDAVGMCDRVQAVRDGERRAAPAEMCHRLAHLQFGFRIERGGRLVEQDDRRVLDQRARDRDALALAAG